MMSKVPYIRPPEKNTDGVGEKMAVCDGDEMFLQSEFEGPILPWDRFKKWVTCFCVVTFDIELGQALEVSVSKGIYSGSLICVFRETRVHVF